MTMPRTGILAFDPKGTWYVAKGILSSNSTGITIVHIITSNDKIISHNASLICICDISYMYIANKETEHEKVIIKTVFGKKLRICFSIK